MNWKAKRTRYESGGNEKGEEEKGEDEQGEEENGDKEGGQKREWRESKRSFRLTETILYNHTTPQQPSPAFCLPDARWTLPSSFIMQKPRLQDPDKNHVKITQKYNVVIKVRGQRRHDNTVHYSEFPLLQNAQHNHTTTRNPTY